MDSQPKLNETSTTGPRPVLGRTMSVPITPTSPLATNPWYRQKFEFVCRREKKAFLASSLSSTNFQYRDAIEEKVRDEYPDIPKTYKLEPSNIERSTAKGYDLDFPVYNNQLSFCQYILKRYFFSFNID